MSLLDYVRKSRELEGGFEVVHVGSKQRIHEREGLPSQLCPRARLPRYRQAARSFPGIFVVAPGRAVNGDSVTVGFWGAWCE